MRPLPPEGSELWTAARETMTRYGSEALSHARRTSDRYTGAGDLGTAVTWLRIESVIMRMQAAARVF
jgi:hypothetical protein